MANEVTFRTELNIAAGNLAYRASANFQTDMDGRLGPSPGAFVAPLAGTAVDLSALSQPGFCVLRNLGEEGYVEVGISDGTEFYPFMELLPGETFTVRLSRFLGKSLDDSLSGTASYDGGTYSLFVKAVDFPCPMSVEAFDA